MADQGSAENEAPEVNREPRGKTLIIERYPYGIRLYVKGSDESCFIKDSDKEGWLTCVIEKNREMVDVVDDNYENLGVEDLHGLYYKLVEHPVKYYEMLTGKKDNLGYLITISDYKFEVCVIDTSLEDWLTEVSECYGVHKDRQEIDYNDNTKFPPVWVPTFDVQYDYDTLLQIALENPEQGIKEIDKYIK